MIAQSGTLVSHHDTDIIAFRIVSQVSILDGLLNRIGQCNQIVVSAQLLVFDHLLIGQFVRDGRQTAPDQEPMWCAS